MARMLAEELLASAKAVGKSGTVYTDAVKFRGSCFDGACCLIVTTAGSITITQQCSQDNITWYDPVNASGTALGAVAATLTAGSRYAQYTPVIAPYIRYKVVEGGTAATALTLTLIYQEDTV